MRQINKLLGTGCFFLCLGGWVYSGQANADEPATQPGTAKMALNSAVQAAASGQQIQSVAAPAPVAASDNLVPAQVMGGNNPPAASAAAPVVTAAPVASATPAVATATPAAPATPAAADAPAATPAASDTAAAAPAATEPGAGAAASAVVNVSPDGTVEQFDAPDLDITTALYLLSLQTKRNIIASKDVKGTVNAHLHNVTFQEALDALLTPNGFGYIEKGNFIYVYSDKELEDIKKRDRKTVNHVFHLKYMTAADAAVLVKPMLSSTGQMALTPPAVIGIPEGATDTGGEAYATDDTLVINDYPENLTDVDKTLHELDVRPKQVLIESTILSASLQEDNNLGIDLVSLSGIDFPTLSSALGTTTASTSGTTTGSTSSVVSPPGPLAGGLVANGNTQVNAGTNFANTVPTGGLSIGFLSNHISAFIRALETTTDITVVANPKILALNKHRGEVFIGDSIGYTTTQQTQTSTTQTVQYLDTGTKLIFRPYITDDGYVRLEVHPEDSSPRVDNNLPGKTSTELTTNLMIRDGRTVVLGGMFREQTTAGRGQVPILGNIPILGVPFRQTSDSTTRKEVIVLLTPHVINDDTALYEESEKKQEDVTRMMLGNRAGLQPWGRDRLAQTWFSLAHDALDKGDREKALMYTDWALNSNPRFIEAIKLREELSGKKVQEADESSISSFARDILRDDKATTPDLGGPAHPPKPMATTQPGVGNY